MKFSIRDLLWLTALAALAVTWWLDHRHMMNSVNEMAAASARSRYDASVAEEKVVLLQGIVNAKGPSVETRSAHRLDEGPNGSDALPDEDPFK